MASLYSWFVWSIAVCYIHISTISTKELGYFWHVTDFHYDSNYSTTGDPSHMCHRGNQSGANIGSYGNYLCDAPWQLVTAAIQGMHDIQPDPDFIIWTGDSVPHVPDSDLDLQKVYSLIRNVSDALVTQFPNKSIFPVLGNHDPYPANMMPYDVDKTGYYKGILESCHWDQMLGTNQSEQFLNGGYYSVQLSDKLRLLGLNTNLYYDQDKLTKDIPDPANQLAWLTSELQRARRKDERVYIVAHVPPGVFELVEDMMWFYADYNRKFLDVLLRHSDVIEAQLYGHEHTDSFRVLTDSTGQTVGALLLSPAVTPWKSTLQGVGANNPSLRLFTYDKSTGVLQKYQQYFLNLTEANVLNNASQWRVEYDTSDDYGLDELRPGKLRDLAKDFNIRQNKLFAKYLKFNSVKWSKNDTCDDQCFLRHSCAITELDMDSYKACMTGGSTTMHPHSSSPRHHHSTPAPQVPEYIYIVIGALAGIVFFMFLVVAFVCYKRQRGLVPQRYAKFGSLSVNTES